MAKVKLNKADKSQRGLVPTISPLTTARLLARLEPKHKPQQFKEEQKAPALLIPRMTPKFSSNSPKPQPSKLFDKAENLVQAPNVYALNLNSPRPQPAPQNTLILTAPTGLKHTVSFEKGLLPQQRLNLVSKAINRLLASPQAKEFEKGVSITGPSDVVEHAAHQFELMNYDRHENGEEPRAIEADEKSLSKVRHDLESIRTNVYGFEPTAQEPSFEAVPTPAPAFDTRWIEHQEGREMEHRLFSTPSPSR